MWGSKPNEPGWFRARNLDVTLPEQPGSDLSGKTVQFEIGTPPESLDGLRVTLVMDLVAGPKWPSLLDVLRPGGRYATAGAIGLFGQGGVPVGLPIKALKVDGIEPSLDSIAVGAYSTE